MAWSNDDEVFKKLQEQIKISQSEFGFSNFHDNFERRRHEMHEEFVKTSIVMFFVFITICIFCTACICLCNSRRNRGSAIYASKF